MNLKWLNLVLLITNRIYEKKQLVLKGIDVKVIGTVFSLFFLELLLVVISLPLYFTVSSTKVAAYFVEKGVYAKIVVGYNLRRILTITGIGIIVLLWAIKLLLILFFPLVYGSQQIFSVSSLKPSDILNSSLMATEIGIQTARIVSTIPKPELSEIRKKSRGDYVFLGKGQPNSVVVLLLSYILYTAEVNKNGEWQIDHKQSNFKLSEGDHLVTIFSYDSKLGVRSEVVSAQYFKVASSWFDFLVKNIDTLVNGLVVIIIFFGIFLILLTV